MQRHRENLAKGALAILFVVPGLLLMSPNLVEAITLAAYPLRRCVGTGTLYENVLPNVCVDLAENLTASISFSENLCESYGYRLPGCGQAVAAGTRSPCITYGKGMKSARLVCPEPSPPALPFLADIENVTTEATCVKPRIAGVVYTEDASEGSWILHSGDVDGVEILNQLENVPEDEKVNWLQARGASFRRAAVAAWFGPAFEPDD